MKVFQLIAAAALLSVVRADEDGLNRPRPSPAPGGAPAPAPSPGPGPHGLHHPAPRGDGPAPSGAPTTTTSAAIKGCTDKDACNHELDANIDDGSCSYPTVGENCDGTCLDSAPMDCAGVCGGNTVCCPQTCFASGGKTGMSCDEVGEALTSGSSSSTCSSLELSGCDCTGCGCGIIIDDDGYEIPDGMEASGLTCDKSAKLTSGGQPCTAAKTCNADECKAYCTDDDSCTYAGWNTQGGCILYNNCKVTRTVASVTTTYHKVPANQGVLDDGTCTCTWWTCVNDDGLGYCE